MKSLVEFLGKTDRILTAVLKWLTIILFLILATIVIVNILLRIFPFTSLHWADEIVELCFAWLVFYGAAAVWMVKGHFSVGDWIGKVVKGERAKYAFRLALEVITLFFALILCKYSLDLAMRSLEVTSVFQIPKSVLYSCMPISAMIMVAYSIVFVAQNIIGIVNPKIFDSAENDHNS